MIELLITQKQLAEAEKVIDEMTSRALYTYSNTSCDSCKERVLNIAKVGTKHRDKYKEKYKEIK